MFQETESKMAAKLCCSRCKQTCDRAIIDGKFYEVKICTCGSLFCGICAHSKKCTCSDQDERKQFPLLSKLCTFANVAPRDQLILIDLQVRTGNCSGCDTTKREQYRCQIQQVLCYSCGRYNWWSPEYFPWLTTSTYEDKFMQIIGHTLRDDQPQTPWNHDMLPMQITDLNCMCGTAIPCQPFMINEHPLCKDCYALYFPFWYGCSCPTKFIACIECIPENQLHKLTYSKWVEAVGCDIHANFLNELNAASSDGLRVGKLRSFFKDGDMAAKPLPKISVSGVSEQPQTTPVMDPTTTKSTNKSDVRYLTSHLSTLDTSTPLTPNRILCQCGRGEDISNVFVCNTCSVCGVCSLCIIRKHSGHEYQDAVKTMVTISCVNTQSELTLHKLTKWSVEAKELNQESEKAFEKLCTTLGSTFVEVITCDDHQRIQSVLEKTDTSTLEKHFKDSVKSTRKLHKAIDYFCEELTEAVEKDKETDTTSVQETSDVDRK